MPQDEYNGGSILVIMNETNSKLNLNLTGSYMNKKSTALLTVLDGQKSERTSKFRGPETSQALICQVLEDLKSVKKQLKQKVSRSQFLSSLSTKVSLSQLASWGYAEIPSKENLCPNRYNQEAYKKMQQQVEVLGAEIKQNKCRQLLNQVQKMKEKQYALQSEEVEIVGRLEQKLNQFQESQKQRLAEVQAYVYRKAERSQMQKLFALNELLVIQIQQAKQRVEDYQKANNLSIRGVCQQLQSLRVRGWEESHRRHQFAQLQNRINYQISQRSSQIDRILDILETKQTNKQQKQQLYDTHIELLNRRVEKLQMDEKLILKELVTRVSVLELKQSHITQSVKQVDILRTQSEALRQDLQQLSDKSMEVHQSVRSFCESTAFALRSQLQSNLNRNLELACSEILNKIALLADEFASLERVNGIFDPVKDKIRQMSQSQSEMLRKIQYLDKNQIQVQEILEQEIQRNQERLSSLRKQLQLFVNHRQLHQSLMKLVKIDELKEIGKQIDKKMENQIGKVLSEQGKINQVLCSQNIMAKWFWSSAILKGGNLVAWDRQIVNTLPENFKWVKGQPSVLIRKGGYYRLQMGFYSKKKPTAQLIVNGQTIVSAVNSNSYVLHHSSGKLKDVSSSEIAGLTYVDYFLLPDEARIAISYMGQVAGEGFLAIHRI